jgi:2-iminobutanoate/2-iminopropanoate deaminase
VNEKRPIQTNRAPAAIGPYSQGVAQGNLLFTSGQIPMTPAGELVVDDIRSAARQCLDNVVAVLAAGGATAADVLKVTIFLTDMGNFAAVNEVYADAFSAPYPARSCVQVAGLPRGVPIEIEAVGRIASGNT